MLSWPLFVFFKVWLNSFEGGEGIFGLIENSVTMMLPAWTQTILIVHHSKRISG